MTHKIRRNLCLDKRVKKAKNGTRGHNEEGGNKKTSGEVDS